MRGEIEALRRFCGAHEPALLGAKREYAVLCPLLDRADGPHLLFETRSERVAQGGEVCFPGGERESGESVEACVLRETREELAIPPEEITLFGQGDFICNQRGFLLRCVVGEVSAAGFAAIRPSENEVAGVFTVPLSFFRETPPRLWRYDLVADPPADFPYAEIGVPDPYPWANGRVEVPLWRYEGHAIWGMTARLVMGLLSHLE
ncbi:MAG: CoA pyrophosphatase [Oscillibacter sp.]|nr:CoA pyrophosphatase [Oscillibacter sp.]